MDLSYWLGLGFTHSNSKEASFGASPPPPRRGSNCDPETYERVPKPGLGHWNWLDRLPI